MKDVITEVTDWAERGDRVALATVVAVNRSAPRAPGSKMAVNEHGEIAGGVSGGCVEGAVVELAEQVMRGEEPRLVHFGIADSEAWEVGLPCGGEIDVWVQAYQPGRFGELARTGGRAVEVTLLEGSRPGAKLLMEADGQTVWVTARGSNYLLGFSAEGLRTSPRHALIAKGKVGRDVTVEKAYEQAKLVGLGLLSAA